MQASDMIFVVLVETDGERDTFMVTTNEKDAIEAADEAASTVEFDIWLSVRIETWSAEGKYLGYRDMIEKDADPDGTSLPDDDEVIEEAIKMEDREQEGI